MYWILYSIGEKFVFIWLLLRLSFFFKVEYAGIGMAHSCFKWTKFSILSYGKKRKKSNLGLLSSLFTSWDNQNASSISATGRMRSNESVHGILPFHFSFLSPAKPSHCLLGEFLLQGCCGPKVNPALSDKEGMIIVFGWLNQNSYCRLCQLPQLLNWNLTSRHKCFPASF